MTKTTTSKRPVSTVSKDSTPGERSLGSATDTMKIFYPNQNFSMSTSGCSEQVERINERELHSIYALLAYVAHNQNVAQDTVQMIVEAEFRVDNVAKIQRSDYMKAIEFLIDLRMDEVVN